LNIVQQLKSDYNFRYKRSRNIRFTSLH